MEQRSYFFDLSFEQLQQMFRSWDLPYYRAGQVWEGIYQNLWRKPDEITTLSKQLRRRLSENIEFSHLQAVTSLDSLDGQTRKTLFRLPDNQAIEAVLMSYHDRRTLCISTQAGCAMDCVFCATGQMGFRRNLSSGEIVEQVLYYARSLQEKEERVTNVVVMGMGEPFHNYEATMEAIERLNHKDGFNLGARRFTVSTVGLVPMIQRYASEQRQFNLAVSLHTIDDELRSSMLPINRKYPVSDLLEACRQYVAQTNRRITFEWALIKDLNDTAEQANKLGSVIRDLLCHVNVIPLNPTRRYAGEATTRARAQEFKRILASYGVPCTIRVRRGIDIQAGCGQLAIENSG